MLLGKGLGGESVGLQVDLASRRARVRLELRVFCFSKEIGTSMFLIKGFKMFEHESCREYTEL